VVEKLDEVDEVFSIGPTLLKLLVLVVVVLPSMGPIPKLEVELVVTLKLEVEAAVEVVLPSIGPALELEVELVLKLELEEEVVLPPMGPASELEVELVEDDAVLPLVEVKPYELVVWPVGPWLTLEVEVVGTAVEPVATQSAQLLGIGLLGSNAPSLPQSAQPYGSPPLLSTPPLFQCPGRGQPGKAWLPVGRGTALEVFGGCLKGGACQ
jgi:hypothetical protein